MKLIEEFDIIYHFKDDESELGFIKLKVNMIVFV